MVEFGGCFGFLDEATLSFRISDEFERKDFESDFAVELQVEGTVDDTHTASADFREYLVVGEGSADQ
jgi:hypothetical protein